MTWWAYPDNTDVKFKMSKKLIKGKIASWNQSKGFGFIMPSDGGNRIFVHIRAFTHRMQQPKVNDVVSYFISTDHHGRPCANKVSKAGVKFSKTNQENNHSRFTIGATLFLIIVVISALMENALPFALPLYLAVSLLTFMVYAMDKSAARRGTWRTPESTLHLLAIVGGWPGAIVAQQTLRHKSQKQPFRFVFWLTAVTNIGVFIWLHTPAGTTALSAVINRH